MDNEKIKQAFQDYEDWKARLLQQLHTDMYDVDNIVPGLELPKLNAIMGRLHKLVVSEQAEPEIQKHRSLLELQEEIRAKCGVVQGTPFL